MAKEKKRGFFSWLGFGQKEQTPEKETEVQNEQPVVEEIVPAQEPAKASEQTVEEQPQAHTEAEAETFAADVVELHPCCLAMLWLQGTWRPWQCGDLSDLDLTSCHFKGDVISKVSFLSSNLQHVTFDKSFFEIPREFWQFDAGHFAMIDEFLSVHWD